MRSYLERIYLSEFVRLLVAFLDILIYSIDWQNRHYAATAWLCIFRQDHMPTSIGDCFLFCILGSTCGSTVVIGAVLWIFCSWTFASTWGFFMLSFVFTGALPFRGPVFSPMRGPHLFDLAGFSWLGLFGFCLFFAAFSIFGEHLSCFCIDMLWILGHMLSIHGSTLVLMVVFGPPPEL